MAQLEEITEDEREARARLKEYLSSLQKGDFGYKPKAVWLTDDPEYSRLDNGEWLVRSRSQKNEGVLLKRDGTAIPFWGALGSFVDLLGFPVSREYFLGSASNGRYQYYDNGLAVWEAFDGETNLGYPVASWTSLDQRAKSCRALVAFIDLRNFTTWSASQDAQQIQEVLETVEKCFQEAFSRSWCRRIFAKGTGDGIMAVSETGWYTSGEVKTDGNFQAGHAKAFCQGCIDTIQMAEGKLPPELAVGCGVSVGNITQLYLLGRYDYIGPAVNEAAKIQPVAFNEICISSELVELLDRDGVSFNGKDLPGKGVRLGLQAFS